MSDDHPPQNLAAGIVITREVIKAAGDNPNVKAAGNEVGRAALTIVETINTALLPLAAVNFAFKKARIYFEGKFQEDLGNKAKKIPPENIIEPKPSIAGPALQGLAFSHEEPSLKEMYLNLLKAAMDDRAAESAHPAFVEIIRQLTGEEAQILNEILSISNLIPIVDVRLIYKDPSGWKTLCNHFINIRDKETSDPFENVKLPAMIENWIRLGLVVVDYGSHIVGETSYDWVETRPEYERYQREYSDESHEVGFQKGRLQRTSFGTQFASVVGIVNTDSAHEIP